MPIRSGVTFCVDIIFVLVEIVRTMQLNPNRQERDRIFSNIGFQKKTPLLMGTVAILFLFVILGLFN